MELGIFCVYYSFFILYNSTTKVELNCKVYNSLMEKGFINIVQLYL